MADIGYGLASEELGPGEIVRYASRAEEVGFSFAVVSDHFHPWTDAQGESPFVWSVLGGVAASTERIRVGTGVTCPTVRMHPAIVAHAAATAAAMMPGRFFLGVGTGENLNEHVLGDRWPSGRVRVEMLSEAIEIMRLLWRGGYQSFRGRFYTVEVARLFTLPDQPPPIYVAAAKPAAAALAGDKGDGLINTSPDSEIVARFDGSGGSGKPKVAQVKVCWAKTKREGARLAQTLWPNAALPGDLGYELPLPLHFEQAASMVSADDMASIVPCGPDPGEHAAAVERFVEAGYDHVYLQQIGPDQEGFFRFYEQEVLPHLRRAPARA